MSERRLQDLIRFYSILNRLEKTIGGARVLADCFGRMKWPARASVSSVKPVRTALISARGRAWCAIKVGAQKAKACKM